MLGFLGLPWDEAVLGFHRHAQRKHIHSPTYEAVTRPIYHSSIGRWRNYAPSSSRAQYSSAFCGSVWLPMIGEGSRRRNQIGIVPILIIDGHAHISASPPAMERCRSGGSEHPVRRAKDEPERVPLRVDHRFARHADRQRRKYSPGRRSLRPGSRRVVARAWEVARGPRVRWTWRSAARLTPTQSAGMMVLSALGFGVFRGGSGRVLGGRTLCRVASRITRGGCGGPTASSAAPR